VILAISYKPQCVKHFKNQSSKTFHICHSFVSKPYIAYICAPKNLLFIISKFFTIRAFVVTCSNFCTNRPRTRRQPRMHATKINKLNNFFGTRNCHRFFFNYLSLWDGYCLW
jgi:hypothetical protein